MVPFRFLAQLDSRQQLIISVCNGFKGPHGALFFTPAETPAWDSPG
jgi:hypothetical protein